MLHFLADESCDFAAVRALRAEGFDVLSVAEDWPGAMISWCSRPAPRAGVVLP